MPWLTNEPCIDFRLVFNFVGFRGESFALPDVLDQITELLEAEFAGGAFVVETENVAASCLARLVAMGSGRFASAESANELRVRQVLGMRLALQVEAPEEILEILLVPAVFEHDRLELVKIDEQSRERLTEEIPVQMSLFCK